MGALPSVSRGPVLIRAAQSRSLLPLPLPLPFRLSRSLTLRLPPPLTLPPCSFHPGCAGPPLFPLLEREQAGGTRVSRVRFGARVRVGARVRARVRVRVSLRVARAPYAPLSAPHTSVSRPCVARALVRGACAPDLPLTLVCAPDLPLTLMCAPRPTPNPYACTPTYP